MIRNHKKELIFNFLMPTVVLGIIFGLMRYFLVDYFEQSIGIFLCFIFGAIYYSINITNRNKTEILKTISNRTAIIESYSAIIKYAIESLRNNSKPNTKIYTYKGFSHDKIRERSFFSELITTLKQDKVEEYYRLVTVNTSEDIDSIISFLQKIPKTNSITPKIHFYVNFQDEYNYMSFITIGKNHSITTLPNFDMSTSNIVGHDIGIQSDNRALVEKLIAIFNKIKNSKTTIKLEIADFRNKEQTIKEIELKLNEGLKKSSY